MAFLCARLQPASSAGACRGSQKLLRNNRNVKSFRSDKIEPQFLKIQSHVVCARKTQIKSYSSTRKNRYEVKACHVSSMDSHISVNPQQPPKKKSVPVYVMLPLDTVGVLNVLNHRKALSAGLLALKSVGVEGVMVDVWWGVVEGDGPKAYNWSAYRQLVDMVSEIGLKMQCVMSFHGCGHNVGDHCVISLPSWVLGIAETHPDILFTDKEGNRNCEYLSFGVDEVPVLDGRTPIEAYKDFMQSFCQEFESDLGSVITEIAVGMGPAGELRYPAYPTMDRRWKFPGIGEFQSYDKYMMAMLRAAAEICGKPEWGKGGPHNSGSYKQWPRETGFFHPEEGSWRSEYGRFFLSWYSGLLLAHGDLVANASSSVFDDKPVTLSAKFPGIHWWYNTRSHAAEATAGYFNADWVDGYAPFIRMLKKHGFNMTFTCLEMRDYEQPEYACCSPEGLLRQVCETAARNGVVVSGENALSRFDAAALEQIFANTHGEYLNGSVPDFTMASFTFLRMSKDLFEPKHWREFVAFMGKMNASTTSASPENMGVKEGGDAKIPSAITAKAQLSLQP